MTGTDTTTPAEPRPPSGLARAFVWAVVTIAKILHDSLDQNGKERRRGKKGRKPNEEGKPPEPKGT